MPEKTKEPFTKNGANKTSEYENKAEDQKIAQRSPAKGKNGRPKDQNILTAFLLISFLIVVGSLSALLTYKPTTIPPERFNNGNIKEGKIKKFQNYEELKNFLSEGLENASGYSYLSGIGGALSKNMMRESVPPLPSSDSQTIEGWGSAEKPFGLPVAETGDYSTTNVQIAGVDEGDIVKTDGKYIYAVSGSEVVIAEAYPAENLNAVSRIKLDSNPEGIYIDGDKLAVYGRDYKVKESPMMEDLYYPRRNYNYIYFKVFDLNDKNNPKEERTLNFEGDYTNSRLIGNYVYLVTATSPYYYPLKEEIPVPHIIENGETIIADPAGSGGKVCARCISPDVYYFDLPYQSYNFTSVNAINISDSSEKINSKVYLLDGNQNTMFVSQNNIYITFTKRVSEERLVMDIVMGLLEEKIFPQFSQADRNIIEEIKNTKGYILSPEEKFAKMSAIMQKYENVFDDKYGEEFQKELERRVKQKYEDLTKELEKTVIHKIAIKGLNLEYKAAGEVPGSVLNQFSMDEDGEYFRIATTKNQEWSSFVEMENRESYNNLYVLDKEMKVAGKVEKLAKNERIYSVRFMQGRAYMVTFRQTDPLFVIDLKDPNNPKVLGKLKVPGFSSYLHPYDETTLIGLGKESDDQGRITGGVKLSLFDVSDVENPEELDKYILGGRNSDSIAINEHKAFLFSKDKNLLVIPLSEEVNVPIISIPEGISLEEMKRIMPPPPIKKYFNGAAIFSIDKYRFNLRGKIDHADSSSNANWYDYNNAVARSLYIKDALYTLSNRYIKANALEDLKEVKTLELNTEDNGIKPLPFMSPME